MEHYPESYEEEPAIVFQPVSETDYCQFYAMETSGFRDDLPFYQRCSATATSVLELGCGYGRVSGRLVGVGRSVIGIDLSQEMLRLARNQEHGRQSRNTRLHFVRMDIRCLALRTLFDTIVIPYNTLNLLQDKPVIQSCLTQCHALLSKHGAIAAQLHIPLPIPSGSTATHRRTFQFQIFTQADGGKVIKEILKHYIPAEEKIEIEERYRIRPGNGRPQRDLAHSYAIAALPMQAWEQLFEQSGFVIHEAFDNYSLQPGSRTPGSTLLLVWLKKK